MAQLSLKLIKIELDKMIKMKTAIAIINIFYKWIIDTYDKGQFQESDEALKDVIDGWGNKVVNEEYKGLKR